MQFVILILVAIAAIFFFFHIFLAAIGKIILWVAIICVLLFLDSNTY